MATTNLAQLGKPSHPMCPSTWVIVGVHANQRTHFHEYLTVEPEKKRMLPSAYVSDKIVLSGFYTLIVEKEAAKKAGRNELKVWPDSAEFLQALALYKLELKRPKKKRPVC